MVNFLIHGRTLLSSLFKRMGTEESLDFALRLLRSDANINGYVSSRSVDIIERDVEYYTSSDIALNIVSNIKSGFSICQASPQAVDWARQSRGPFDTALEISCAREQGVDFILTQNVDDFRDCGFLVMSMDEWLRDVWPISLGVNKLNSQLAIITGGLEKVQALSEFCVTSRQGESQVQPNLQIPVQEVSNQILSLRTMMRKHVEYGWQSIEEVLDIPLEYRRITSRNSTRKELAKILVLSEGHYVVLLISYEPNRRHDIEIQVSLFSRDCVSEIPGKVNLSLLDQWQRPAIEEEAENPRNLQLQFSGKKGEVFFLSSQIGTMSYIEQFMI